MCYNWKDSQGRDQSHESYKAYLGMTRNEVMHEGEGSSERAGSRNEHELAYLRQAKTRIQDEMTERE